MPSDNNDGIIKNPRRAAQAVAPNYTPEYVRLGKNPVPAPNGWRGIPITPIDEEPIRSPGVLPVSLLTNQKSNPNVPSTLETYDTFDDQIITAENEADYQISNDLDDDEVIEPVFEPQSFRPNSNDTQENGDDTPEIGQYILMVQGKVVMTGDLEFIETRIKHILYGEDKNYEKLSTDDIVVLKRVGLKIGVFINE